MPQTPVHTARAPTDFLSVQRRDVVDGAGNPVLLRGINVDTYYYSFVWDPTAAWRYADQEDINLLADMGMTSIRLGLHWGYFQSDMGFDLIDTYLDWCEQAGIYVVLDMHVVPPEDDILEGRIWDNPAAQQQFLDIWRAIATRYADDPRIAGYDIYNEPSPPSADQWWDLAARTIRAIRAVDTNHMLFIEAPLGDNSDLRLVDDDNVVYSFHDYQPFSVSHAGAGWVGDSVLPARDRYPGPALVNTEWADYAPDINYYGGRSDEWVFWDSGTATVPAGVEFATPKPATDGNSGDVWFDDLTLFHNGVARPVANGDMETPSDGDPDRPANWYFWSDSGFSGTWSDEAAASGTRSLKISSDGSGFGVWTQANWILTAPLVPVQAGDTLRLQGQLRSPDNVGGAASLGFDYLRGVYEEYDRDRLAANLQPYLDWGAANNVPLYVGEFGAMSSAPGTSRSKLVRDMIDVMNAAGLHWALWTLRGPDSPTFGLFFNDDLDHSLARVLRDGLAPADADVWRRTNPGGGGAFATVGAGPNGLILAASDLSGAYRSVDGGYAWDPIGADRGLFSTHVSGLGFDPVDPDLVYLGTDWGLYRSADAGESVTRVLDGGYVTAIAIAPGAPAVGYAARHSEWNVADGQVYRTTNRGLNWSRTSSAGLPANLHILDLLVDPRDADVVHLLAGEGRFACGPAVLYSSRDGGRNWTRLAPDLGQAADIALDPDDADILYLSTYGDVWDPGYTCVADDAGGGYLYRGDFDGTWQWTRLTDGENLAQRNLAIWPDRDDRRALRVIDLDYPEVWESTDGGATWTFISSKDTWEPGWSGLSHVYHQSFNGNALTQQADPSDPDGLLWADGQFIWATRDDGRTFGPLHTTETSPGHWQSRGVDNIVTNDLALSADSSYIYLAMPDLGCFRSDDDGASWQNCNDLEAVGTWNGHGGNAMTLAADPARANVVWVTLANEIDASHTLLRSENYAATWTKVGAGLPVDGVPSGLVVDPASPVDSRTLYVTWGGDVFTSADDGVTWRRLFACGGCRVIAVRRDDAGRVLLAGGEAGLWRSSDDGATWDEVGPPEMRGALGDEFWASWWEGVRAVVPDPHVTARFYAVAYGSGRGLYRSDDLGATWKKVLDDDYLRDVAISPVDADVILVGAASATYAGGYDPASTGVRYSDDAGAMWTPFNQGLAWPFANVLRIDPNDPGRVWLGSSGTGYHTRRLPEHVPDPAPQQFMFLPVAFD
jgi:aryl-phospho-beta-D-glucosidase BglC (GH1 family)/photosystem II stability/assembly factor-like uncharacterized protein